MNLEKEHEDCVTRPRRLLNHNDPAFFNYRPSLLPPEEYAEVVLDFTRWEEFRFDSVLWDVDGAMACYPSRLLPHYPSLKEWLDAGNDFLPQVVSLSRQRGLEVFLSFRVNAGQDPNFDLAPMRGSREWLVDFEEDPEKPPRLELPRLDGEVSMKKLDYANPEVRAFQLGVLGELAGYDVDGLQLDFARGAPFLRVGHQWELRGELTRFMREVREMMRRRARERGRPLLLAARVAESIEGCRFDGIDIETWVREGLVDLLIAGARSFDVDIAAFKRLPGSERVKVYPCHDNHHSSDGYKCTPLPVLRGLASKWWRQGADGIAVFNFRCSDDRAVEAAGLRPKPVSPCHLQDWDTNRTFLSEAGDPGKLAGKKKTFALQRRSGGAPWEFGYPEDGITVIHAFQNANALAPLPAQLGRHGRGVTYFKLYVGESARSLGSCEARLRLLASDEAEDGPEEQRVGSGLIRRNPYVWGDGLYTVAMARETAGRLEIRFNNIRLRLAAVDEGWLVYPVAGAALASGENLLTVKLEEGSEGISIEKVELDLASDPTDSLEDPGAQAPGSQGAARDSRDAAPG
ncbi:MAG: hypothetical protein OXH50_01710 [Gemmatimonadetes bacterium]|nr:hypothetical protein [Gemmatimonadota bacterium]